jgi:hypothetical protein
MHPQYTKPLASTGNTPAAGLVVALAPPTPGSSPTVQTVCVVRGLYVYNSTGAPAWCFLANAPAVPTSFADLVGCPILVPSLMAIEVDSFFGPGGWSAPFTKGCAVGISTSNTVFGAAGASFDIQVSGEAPGIIS